MVIGEHRFGVRIPYPGMGNLEIAAQISADPVQHAPEPGSLALAFGGLVGVAVFRRRK
jgi:hypothetical protein